MTNSNENEKTLEKIWRTYLTTGRLIGVDESIQFPFQRLHPLILRLPRDPRCAVCRAPFNGIGGFLMKTLEGRTRSTMNPRFCNICEQFARKYQGGAEIELSMLFADVRGSTSLAEKMSPSEFTQLINRFYKEATEVLIHSDALVEKMIGDEVTGLFVPGFAGNDHARIAVEAGKKLLEAMGYGSSPGSWIPVGIGIHTGTAYVGSVGTQGGMIEITALGDAANTAARIASQASAGEILVSEAACTASGLSQSSLTQKTLQLKGRTEPVNVYALTISN